MQEMTLPYRHNIDNLFAESIGATGLPRAQFETNIDALSPSLTKLRQHIEHRDMPLLALPSDTEDLAVIGPIAEGLVERFDDIVILGIGGSSLGAQSVVALADPGRRPRLHLPDNLDGLGFSQLLAQLQPETTFFIAVSKSGGTSEPLSQTLAALSWLGSGLGQEMFKAHMLTVVEPTDNVLRRLSDRLQLPRLDHDPEVGGRFSVLSVVGMLPALLAGLSAAEFRKGAAAVLNDVATSAVPAPAAGAAALVGLQRDHGVSDTVVLPYCNRLQRFAAWHSQLWAESLGKQGKGMTPIAALGPVDQHSQLQLWLDGPNTKSFTLIEVESEGTGPEIDISWTGDDPALDYLAGHKIGDVVAAEFKATAATLAANGRATRIISVDCLTETTLGALFMHFILECMLTADLLGVDPFGQPAVEEGKILTRDYLRKARQ